MYGITLIRKKRQIDGLMQDCINSSALSNGVTEVLH